MSLPADHRLVLSAALGEKADAREAWSQFLSRGSLDDEWDHENLCLLPTVFRNLGPDEFAEKPRLAGVYRKSWVQTQDALLRVESTLETLAGAGILACEYGETRVARCYPDLGCRAVPIGEVLVDPDDAVATLRHLRSAGWETTFKASEEDLVRYRDSATLENVDRGHVRIVWEPFHSTVSPDRARALVLPMLTGAEDMPAVLRLASATAPSGFPRAPRTRSIVDLAMVGRAPGADWGGFLRLAEDLDAVDHAAPTVRDALPYLDSVPAELREFAGRAASSPTLSGRRTRWARAGRNPVSRVIALPRFLCAEWNLDSPMQLWTQLPRHVGARIRRRWR